jgi:hypothetical protein
MGAETASEAVDTVYVVLAVLCTLIGWVVTMTNIAQHFSHWNAPELQKIIVKMLVLVIIWSTFSLFVVVRPEMKPLTQVAMDSYEAYLLVQFMSLMSTYLGGPGAAFQLVDKMPPYRFLVCFHVQPRRRTIFVMRVLVYQFAVVKPFLAVVRCVLAYMDVYVGLSFDVQNVFTLVRVVMLISLVLAMMGLLLFYKAFYQALQPYKVGVKFMAMKLFIFLHLAQGLIFGLFEDEAPPGEAHGANYYALVRLEYFVVCLEMALASIANKYAIFNYREFMAEDMPQKPWIEYFRMDDARLNEWKSTLSSHHLVRQDSMTIEQSTPHAPTAETP